MLFVLIDLDGAVKTIEAAEKTGIERFIMVSALHAQHRENWHDSIKPYYVAKHYADKILEYSNLNYTIIRSGGLLNEEGTGTITAAENIVSGSIPCEDVASVVVASLNEENTFRRSFDVISGDEQITTALKQL